MCSPNSLPNTSHPTPNQTLLETKRDMTRQVERLQDALDSANEVRKSSCCLLQPKIVSFRMELIPLNTTGPWLRTRSSRRFLALCPLFTSSMPS